ncbi:MAG: SAM-dependent methyltransferase [Acidimicrobiia bacterium]
MYDPEGFFGSGRGAGRSGADFVTSPEVGPLFGELVARWIDRCWDRLGRPDPFVVVEGGAGVGRLAREILRARPRCAKALRYVLVERSARLRAEQRSRLELEPAEDALGPWSPSTEGEDALPVAGTGPIVTALDDLPSIHADGVVLANELLDNLPFRVVEARDGVWCEVRVGLEGERFVEVIVPAAPELHVEAEAVLRAAGVPDGVRLPVQTGASDWIARAAALVRHGFVAFIDYGDEAEVLAAREDHGWLRTYAAHGRGGSPLEALGEQDVTADVVLGTVRRAARRAGLETELETTQAAWLDALGVEDLLDEARATWGSRIHQPDLEAIRFRSRLTEAPALLDPEGLGAHRVLVYRRGELRPDGPPRPPG